MNKEKVLVGSFLVVIGLVLIWYKLVSGNSAVDVLSEFVVSYVLSFGVLVGSDGGLLVVGTIVIVFFVVAWRFRGA